MDESFESILGLGLPQGQVYKSRKHMYPCNTHVLQVFCHVSFVWSTWSAWSAFHVTRPEAMLYASCFVETPPCVVVDNHLTFTTSPTWPIFEACYRHAEPLRLTLEPGQLLYLPAGWWHCVEGSMEPNMILTPRWSERADRGSFWVTLEESHSMEVDGMPEVGQNLSSTIPVGYPKLWSFLRSLNLSWWSRKEDLFLHLSSTNSWGGLHFHVDVCLWKRSWTGHFMDLYGTSLVVQRGQSLTQPARHVRGRVEGGILRQVEVRDGWQMLVLWLAPLELAEALGVCSAKKGSTEKCRRGRQTSHIGSYSWFPEEKLEPLNSSTSGGLLLL